jgi:hypothetical protein
MKLLPWGKPSAFTVWLAGLVLLPVMMLAVYSWIELARFAQVESRRAVIIYAAGQTLAPGVHVRLVDLAGTLARLGYVETRNLPDAPDSFAGRLPPGTSSPAMQGGVSVSIFAASASRASPATVRRSRAPSSRARC